MKNLLIIFTLIAFFTACSGDADNTQQKSDNENIETKEVSKTENIQTNKIVHIPENENMKVVAPEVRYPTIIKNPDLEDEWTTENLKNINVQLLAEVFYNAIYEGKIEGYDYQTQEKLTIEQVKAFEKEYTRNRIAKVLFDEEWYFDTEKAKMYKRVNSLMLAYELYFDNGEVKGYKAGVQIFFNK